MKKELHWFEDNTGEPNCVPTVRQLTNRELEEKLFELGEMLKAVIGDDHEFHSRIKQWQEDLKGQ